MKTILLQSIRKNVDKQFILNHGIRYLYKDLFNFLVNLNNSLFTNNHQRVLISMPQGFYAYGSILASYLTNATFCFIAKDLPLERKAHIINQFKPDVILTQNDASISNFNTIPIIDFGDTNYLVNLSNPSETIFSCFDSEIIYVYFTSGSTGFPKGCCIKRISVEKIVLWAIKEFELTGNDIWGQYTPLHFDMSLIDVFGATCLGASLVSFSTVADKLRPGNLIREHKISFLNIVPQVIDILIKAKQLNNEYCQSLSTIRFGGDKVYTCTVEKLFDILPKLIIISTYGPTETTFFCTFMKMNQQNYKNYSTDILTIGEPIPGCKIELENVDNEIGEIVISGEYIGLGYLGSEQFGYNSIEIDGITHRFYRTGDYAKIIQNFLYFYGRKDSQIKINGQRFSLLEIEVAAKKCGCEDCAAIYFNNMIVCFYIDSNKSLGNNRLNELLKTYIQEMFLPQKYISMDQMPYNANGKIDRLKLRKILE